MVAEGEHAISGEVYAVHSDTLAVLDHLEGVPLLYRRMPITLADGTIAETYLANAGRRLSGYRKRVLAYALEKVFRTAESTNTEGSGSSPSFRTGFSR